MPSNDSLWLDNLECIQYQREQPIEPDEEQSVGNRQSRFRGNLSTQDVQLMPQLDDLSLKPRLCLERKDQDVEEQAQERDHCVSA
jgi:hypothetical protein